MSDSAGFPINDLFRRRLQTGLAITTLTLSVASTLFLLLFSSQLGTNITKSGSNMFTLGLNSIFSQYLTFIGGLIFVVGAVLTSFIVALMMAQRTRDFGLIKAAGCPNSLAGGYFMTELIITTTTGCILGTFLGFFADFVASYALFGTVILTNWWYILIVFGVFFGLALFFGLQPIIKAAKLSPAEALSPVNYYGLFVTRKYKALSHRALTWQIASRSMARRLNPIVRIVILLSVVFVLLTVTVAGGIIAKDTILFLVQKTEENTVAIAYEGMGTQYESLLATFAGGESGDFNYSDPNLSIPQSVNDQLEVLPGVSSVQERLVLYENVTEVGNFTVIDGVMTGVGSTRQCNSIVVGINPADLETDFVEKGQILSANAAYEAIAGDSIAQKIYSPDKSLGINMSDPLVQGVKIENRIFQIVGVCVDPIHNGYVTYVPIEKLMNLSGLSNPNLLLVTLDESVDRSVTLEELRNTVKSIDPSLEVFDLTPIIQKNTALLTSTWETIMLIPLFSVASAALCLVTYMMLSIDEQRQEFAMLRAVGARPKLIVNVSAIESALILLSSLGVGLSFGIITTILILMTNPLVTATTIATIATWLLAALLVMFILSLYPAVKLSKMGILQINS